MKGLVLEIELCEKRLVKMIMSLKEVKNFLDEFECCFGEEYKDLVGRVESKVKELDEVVDELYEKYDNDIVRVV